jgi:hypothetical protein
MKKALWGPLVWKVLHCIAIKIKDDEFSKERSHLIRMITGICSNLPCPQCTSHATSIIKRNRLKDVKSKNELIRFIYLMHNIVNKRLKKKCYSFEDMHHYNECNTKHVLSEYFTANVNAKFGEKMMLHSFHRKAFLNEFYNYFKKNISKFNQ